MNRFTQKVLSGGIAAGLLVALAASANAQAARSGAWTLNAPEGEWHMTGRDYSLQRYSPLKQITTSNVAELRPVWSFSTGTLRGHEGNPLVVGPHGPVKRLDAGVDFLPPAEVEGEFVHAVGAQGE